MKTQTFVFTLLVALLTAATQAADTGLKESVQRKLERIVIPKLEFREAPLLEVGEFLRKKSIELDVDSPAAERGVNIVFKFDAGTWGGGLPKDAPAAAPVPGVSAAPVVNPADARVTVSLTDVPLIEALRCVTKAANCKFKVEPYAVSIVPAHVNTDELVTKEWKISPDLIPGQPADKQSAKNWLKDKGIQFNAQTSAVYVGSTSKLVVRNTKEQLDRVDTLITSEAKK